MKTILRGVSGFHKFNVSSSTKHNKQLMILLIIIILDQLNTTVHGTMLKSPYELAFGQPPRLGVFPGAKTGMITEEEVEDIIEEDGKILVLICLCMP